MNAMSPDGCDEIINFVNEIHGQNIFMRTAYVKRSLHRPILVVVLVVVCSVLDTQSEVSRDKRFFSATNHIRLEVEK